MATPSPLVASVEVSIFELLELRQTCTQQLPDEIMRRINSIRSLCQAAETLDGNGHISWRRGTGSNTNGGSKGPSNGAPPSRWKSNGGGHGGGHRGHPQTNTADKHTGRYVSKYRNSDVPVENKILNQIILNKLNKFSAGNYNEIKEFLEQILDSDEKDFLRDFMQLVFKKASTEPTFCPLYARMISELSIKYTSLKTELDELYKKYISIFEEVSEEQCTNYEQFVQRNREKLHRLGYSQFLGELTSYGVVELNQLKEIYLSILHHMKVHSAEGQEKYQLVEEYVDCIVRMTKAFQKGTSDKLLEIRHKIAEECAPFMEEILANRTTKYPGLSKKAAFAIMDCLDIFRGNTTS